MRLTEQKRQATMHNVLLKLQQLLPSHSAADLQTLLEQLDRDAQAVARGEEDAYIKRMATKLGNVQRNVRKAQGQAAPSAPQQPAQRAGSGLGARQDISRTGSEHSSGSGGSRSYSQQHQLLMQQQQQQALLGARQTGRQAQVPQTPWAAQHQPAPAQPRYALQPAPQRQAQPPAQAHRGAHAAAGLGHLQQPDARQQQPLQRPGVYEPHQAAWRTQQQQQRQPASAQQQQQQLPRHAGTASPSGLGLLQATPSMEQMVYGLILTPGGAGAQAQQQAQQPQPPHQPQAHGAHASQTPSFMEMLTSDAPQPQPQPQQLAPPAQVPQPAPGRQPGYAPPAASAAAAPSAAGAAGAAGAGALPQRGLDGGEDCTDAYWALMARVQADIVPSLERLQPRFAGGAVAARPGAPDWERLRAKMAEILRLLPRLKIRRDDPRYATRVWSRREFEQMQKIERQLGPYCDRFFPKGQQSAGAAADAAAAGQSGSAGPALPPLPAQQQPAGAAHPAKESPASHTGPPAAPSPPAIDQPDAAPPPGQAHAPQPRPPPPSLQGCPAAVCARQRGAEPGRRPAGASAGQAAGQALVRRRPAPGPAAAAAAGRGQLWRAHRQRRRGRRAAAGAPGGRRAAAAAAPAPAGPPSAADWPGGVEASAGRRRA